MASAFFITPFAPTEGEDPEEFEAVQRAVRMAADAAGVDLVRADDIFEAGVVIDQIRGAIERADLVIAVCTGRNANVFYELGLAHVAQHLPILIARSAEDLPFDVAHWRAQLYGPPHGIEDLAERVQQAIEETLEAREREPALAAPQQAEGPQRPDPLAIVQEADFVQFSETVRALISDIGDRHTEVADENWDVRPTDTTLQELRALRFESVEELMVFLRPAIAYQPDWLERVWEQIGGWFGQSPRADRSGYVFWIHFHETWTSLSAKAILAVALLERSYEVIQQGVSLLPPEEGRQYDGSPLLINPIFTWPKGYHGNSSIAFDDFLDFLDVSEALPEVRDLNNRDATEVACGTDLALGMARCVWEDARVPEEDRDQRRAPHTYAAFAAYYCSRIRWAASLIEHREEFARALGADSLESMRQIAREWYGLLVQQTEKPTRTCAQWEDAAGI